MKRLVFSIAFATFFLLSCSPEPKPIQYGSDGCHYCKMKIMDDRYGAEIVTKKGKVYTYDSIECMVAALETKQVPESAVHSLYIVDFENPGVFIKPEEAIFVVSKKLASPMGINVSAFSSEKIAQNVAELYFGEQVSWDDVKQLVHQSWFQ